MVEGTLEPNEGFWVLLLGASSFLCCRDFMAVLPLWEMKGMGASAFPNSLNLGFDQRCQLPWQLQINNFK